MTIIPVCIMLLSIVFLKVSITWFNILGVLFGPLGTLLLILYSKPDPGIASNPMLGNLMVFVAVGSFSTYFISVKRLMQKYSGIEVAGYLFTVGFFLVLPYRLQRSRSNSLARPATSCYLEHPLFGHRTIVLGLFTQSVSPKRSRRTHGRYIYLFRTGFRCLFCHTAEQRFNRFGEISLNTTDFSRRLSGKPQKTRTQTYTLRHLA